MSSEPTYTPSLLAADGIAAAHTHSALAGARLGRREQHHRNLRALSEIAIAEVIEEVADLAVADRVAFVLARRTGTTYAVVACAGTFLVVSLASRVGNEDATNIIQDSGEPVLATIANFDGVVPILHHVDSEFRYH